MNTFCCVLVITLAVMTSLPATHSSQTTNLCTECTELLRETIELTLDILRNSATCIETNHPSPAVLVVTQKIITEQDIHTNITNFILELQMINDAWESEEVGEPNCLQYLHIHLKRILCLLKSTNNRRGRCIIRKHYPVPTFSTIGYAVDYINDVYSTLGGFLSVLQE